MAENKLKLRYLGPAVRISPGQDKDGNPDPFVSVGGEIELTEVQVQVLEGQGHQFEGRQLQAGELLRGQAAEWTPPLQPRPGLVEQPAPAGATALGGGALVSTPQHALQSDVPAADAPAEAPEKKSK